MGGPAGRARASTPHEKGTLMPDDEFIQKLAAALGHAAAAADSRVDRPLGRGDNRTHAEV
jgi:hypothetical protein